MAHFHVEAYYEGDTIQEVMSRREEALLNVCFNSLCHLKRGAGNVTKRQPHSAVTRAINLTGRRAKLRQAAPPVVDLLRCSETVADKEVGKP